MMSHINLLTDGSLVQFDSIAESFAILSWCKGAGGT